MLETRNRASAKSRQLNDRCKAALLVLVGEARERLQADLLRWGVVKNKLSSANVGSNRRPLETERDELMRSLAAQCDSTAHRRIEDNTEEARDLLREALPLLREALPLIRTSAEQTKQTHNVAVTGRPVVGIHCDGDGKPLDTDNSTAVDLASRTAKNAWTTLKAIAKDKAQERKIQRKEEQAQRFQSATERIEAAKLEKQILAQQFEDEAERVKLGETAWRQLRPEKSTKSRGSKDVRVDHFDALRDALGAFQVHADYDIFHIKAGNFPTGLACFDQFDHDVYLKSALGTPLRRGKEPVVIGQAQRLAGDHVSLGGQYREKSHQTMLTQLPKLADGVVANRYKNWSHNMLAATCEATAVPGLAKLMVGYNAFMVSLGLAPANQALHRFYEGGSDHIGWHSDEDKDFEVNGLIGVLRTGVSRSFQIRTKDGCSLFDEVMEPGDLVLMTVAANRETEHCVPREKVTGTGGSISFRAISQMVTQTALMKKVGKKVTMERQSTLFDHFIAVNGGEATDASNLEGSTADASNADASTTDTSKVSLTIICNKQAHHWETAVGNTVDGLLWDLADSLAFDPEEAKLFNGPFQLPRDEKVDGFMELTVR